HQQRRGLIGLHRISWGEVLASSQSCGEEGGAGEKSGGIEKQAQHHLPTIGIPAGEDPANVELLPQFINDGVGKTNIVGAQLTRDLRQVLAGIIEVVLDSTGIGNDSVAASQSIKGE